MRLYTYFRSSAAYRVRIALNLKGLAYESVPVNLLKRENTEAGFRHVNPQGRIPALEREDGTVLVQSPAILEYLEETHPEPALLPRDPVARARVRAAAALVACDIHPLNNVGPLRYLKNGFGQEQPAIDTWIAHWITQGFSALEAMLEPGPFAFGATPGMADLYLVPQVYNARRFKVPLEAFPKITAVDAACTAHDAFAAAAPERQPDAA
ncbi:MAG TPA: maleylacetoacetate isomerase [Beijerinckiaceae bacterium]|jgi:maleylacetoacetate isomerase/maleylpyruvate isomerase